MSATDSAMDTGEKVYGGCEGPDAMSVLEKFECSCHMYCNLKSPSPDISMVSGM